MTMFFDFVPAPHSYTLFPYTTLFRSVHGRRKAGYGRRGHTEAARRAPVALPADAGARRAARSEEHTSELQSLRHLVCRLLLEKKNVRARLSTARAATPNTELKVRSLL